MSRCIMLMMNMKVSSATGILVCTV